MTTLLRSAIPLNDHSPPAAPGFQKNATIKNMRPPGFIPGAALFCATLFAQTQSAIEVEVDARDAPRRLIHVQMKMPVTAGPPGAAARGGLTLRHGRNLSGPLPIREADESLGNLPAGRQPH